MVSGPRVEKSLARLEKRFFRQLPNATVAKVC